VEDYFEEIHYLQSNIIITSTCERSIVVFYPHMCVKIFHVWLQIPAIQQFGIFMGVVVLLCFVQVFLVVPHFLFIWHHSMHPLAVFCCKTLKKCVCRKGSDGGVVSYSMTSNGGHQNGLGKMNGDEEGEDMVKIEDQRDASRSVEGPPGQAESWTVGMQKLMLALSCAAMVLHLFPRPRKTHPSGQQDRLQGNQATEKKGRNALYCIRLLVFLVSYGILLGTSVGLVSQLKSSDKPPQFFSPGTNLQKVLDLTGNVTAADVVDGYTLSEWSSDGTSCEWAWQVWGPVSGCGKFGVL